MNVQDHIANVTNSIEKLKDFAISGDIQPHEAFALIKESGLDDYLKVEISHVRDVAIDHIRRNCLNVNEKSYKEGGYQFTIRGGATRYYFTEVPEVKKKKALAENTDAWKEFKSTESKYKTAFLMKQKNQVLVDEDTGEIVDPSKVNVVYGADSLSIKRVKEELV